jgi:hypothetical protein
MGISFWAEPWRKLRPQAQSLVVEVGLYFRYWIVVLIAHVVRIVMAAAGIEPEFVNLVALMEKWVFLASFASFFWRLLVRLCKETRRGAL